MVNRLFDIACRSERIILFEHLHKGELISYSSKEVDRKSDVLACQLIKGGVTKRNKVVSLLKDSPIWNIAENAILKAAGVHVPLPVTTDSERLKRILMMVLPTVILIDSDSTAKRVRALLFLTELDDISLVDVRDKAAHTTLIDEDFSELNHRKGSVETDDTAVILFTSGSTSEAKGVLLSHRSILIAADEFGHSDAFCDVNRSLSILPMSHSAARKVNYACQLRGVTICYAAPSLSLVKNLQTYSVQHMAVVPHLLRMLRSDMQGVPDVAVPLKKVTCGGARLSEEIWQWYENKAISIYEVYGLTETTSLLSYSSDECRRPGCVGKLATNIEKRISESGELEVRGPTLLKAYLHSDGSIVEAVDHTGWFRTGDVVSVDADGGLKITGRAARSYKSQRGNHIHPEEVERKLSKIAGIEEAFVVNGPMEPLKTILILGQKVTVTEMNEHIRKYNRLAQVDLQISQVATMDVESFGQLRQNGDIKLNSRTFTELLKKLEFHTI